MQHTALAQPDVAVEAGTGVPARVGLGAVVGGDENLIVRAVLQVGSEIDEEARVPVGVQGHQLPVDRDLGVHHHALELELHALTLPLDGGVEALAVAHHTVPGVGASRSRGMVRTAGFAN